jgi:anti-anti-sigma factor
MFAKLQRREGLRGRVRPQPARRDGALHSLNFTRDPMNDETIDHSLQKPLVVAFDKPEYDIASSDEFFEVLEPTFNHPSVVVDMSRIQYLDSSCLSKLMSMRKRRGEAGFPPARMVITSRTVKRIFELTGFDKVWPMFDSLEAALEAN